MNPKLRDIQVLLSPLPPVKRASRPLKKAIFTKPPTKRDTGRPILMVLLLAGLGYVVGHSILGVQPLSIFDVQRRLMKFSTPSPEVDAFVELN